MVWHGKTDRLSLGNYVILDRISVGGMGEVFHARHRVMKREVALKILPEDAVGSLAESVMPETAGQHLTLCPVECAEV